MSQNQNGVDLQYDEERCFCQDKEENNHEESEFDDREEEEQRKTSIKWADWEGGKQLQQIKLETTWPEEEDKDDNLSDENCEYPEPKENPIDESLPPLTLAQVKFEPAKSCIVGCVREPEPAPEEVETQLPDTIEAHLELIRERESKLRMKEEVWDQDNPFRPEGELSKEAEIIVGAIKEGRQAITPPPPHSPQIPSSSPSSQPELEAAAAAMDSPDGVDRAMTQEYQTSPRAGTKEAAVVQVERSIIVTSKTENVEHVVIPEKNTTCCACIIL